MAIEQKYDFLNGTLYFGDAPEVAWKDISHVDNIPPLVPK